MNLSILKSNKKNLNTFIAVGSALTFIGFIDIAYIKKSKIKFFKSGLLTSEIYKGEALDFFWNRTVSRINEMQKQT